MYNLKLEDDGYGGKFIHCDIVYYTKTTKKAIQRDFNKLLDKHNPIFALHKPGEHEDPKLHLKFLKIFGFEKVDNVTLTDNSKATLFVHYGDHNGKN